MLRSGAPVISAAALGFPSRASYEQTIIGRFFFKLTDNGNLIGEFSNNHPPQKIYTESAVRKSGIPSDGKFIGEYYSTWYEEPAQYFLAELKITQNHPRILSLSWRLIQGDGKPSAQPSFWGEGMLCDGILIGDYRDFENP